MTDDIRFGGALIGWCFFIGSNEDDHEFTDWTIMGSNLETSTSPSNGIIRSILSYASIPNGFRFTSTPIQIKDAYVNYPLGNFKMLIAPYASGGAFPIGGGNTTAMDYISNNTITFNINDICPTCPAVYEGHDNDNDGVKELYDNCPNTYNPNQLDNDNDGVGDVCDNCPNNSNANQLDTDNDGEGDVCDNDDEGDGSPDNEDNCPLTYNADKNGSDNDGIGDACDDIDDNAMPNLTLESLKFKVGSKSSNVFPGRQFPEFKYGETNEIEIVVKNNGSATSGGFRCSLLVSSSPDAYPLTNGTAVYGYQSGNLGSIAQNGTRKLTLTQTVYDSILGLNLQVGGTYYMYLHIDDRDDVDEEDETDLDNIIIFPFKYIGEGLVAYLNLGNGLIKVPLDDFRRTKKGYNLKVYGNSIFPLINETIYRTKSRCVFINIWKIYDTY